MATDLDHDAIKTQIVAILKANSTLYTTTAEANKLRAIEVGFPQGSYQGTSLSDAMLPYVYVTNSSAPFETIKTGDVVSNAIVVTKHTFNYDIVCVTLDMDSRVAETSLDDFQKLILQTFTADHSLTGATTAQVDSSYVSRVDRLRVGTGDEGKGIKGRIITLTCKKVTG